MKLMMVMLILCIVDAGLRLSEVVDVGVEVTVLLSFTCIDDENDDVDDDGGDDDEDERVDVELDDCKALSESCCSWNLSFSCLSW